MKNHDFQIRRMAFDEIECYLGVFGKQHVDRDFLDELVRFVFRSKIDWNSTLDCRKDIIGSDAFILHEKKRTIDNSKVYVKFPGRYCSRNAQECVDLSKKVDEFCKLRGQKRSKKSYHIAVDFFDVDVEEIFSEKDTFYNKCGKKFKPYHKGPPGGGRRTTVGIKKHGEAITAYDKILDINDRLQQNQGVFAHDLEILNFNRKVVRWELKLKGHFVHYGQDAWDQISNAEDLAKNILLNYLENNEYLNWRGYKHRTWKFLERLCKSESERFISRTKYKRGNPNQEADMVKLCATILKKFKNYRYQPDEEIAFVMKVLRREGRMDVIDLFEQLATGEMSLSFSETAARLASMGVELSDLKLIVQALNEKLAKVEAENHRLKIELATANEKILKLKAKLANRKQTKRRARRAKRPKAKRAC